MSQIDKAHKFAALHVKGKPIVLYNIWDAGSAKSIVNAGATAVATGSWSVAAAQGYGDGEVIPLDLVLTLVSRITASVEAPVSIDFEGGYAKEPDNLQKNIARLIGAGAIGLNFEDQIVGGDGTLYKTGIQQARLEAVRRAGEASGIPLFINARTDLFLKESDPQKHAGLMGAAKERAAAYEAAGASSYFVPGLADPTLIREICDATSLPVNVMMKKGVPNLETLSSLGVARISYGPGPYVSSMQKLAEAYQEIR